MLKFLTTFSFIAYSITSFSQNCPCDSLFLQTKKIVENNYAGWFDKVNTTTHQTYQVHTQQYLSSSQKIVDAQDCAKLLQDWIAFFKDRHLRIKASFSKQSVANQNNIAKDVTIFTNTITEEQAKKYLSTTKNLDAVEGIYKNASYTLAVTKIKQNLFYATVLSTSNENWKPGDVKLIIEKNSTKYKGTFFEGDKTDFSTHTIKPVENILDFDIVFYEKVFPATKVKLDMYEYEMKKDRYAPSLYFKNKDLAVFTFPSFQNNAYEQTEYLLKKHKQQLEKTPYWIIDLRGNDGGDVSIGMQLIKYIANPSYKEYNRQMRMTLDNFNLWYNTYVRSTYENLDANNKKKYDEYFDSLKANYGKMYNPDGKPFDIKKIENSTIFPKKIAVLIDSNTISSGELFTLNIRQSNKIKVFGTNSGGMMDYGNIVYYKTTCPQIRIQLPVDRMLWLDEGISIDRNGLQPQFYLKGKNWIEDAYKIIKQ